MASAGAALTPFPNPFCLTSEAAREKSREIVHRDGFQTVDYDYELQIDGLYVFYRRIDPDTAFKVLNSREPDERVLSDEVKFIMKSQIMEQRKMRMSVADQERLKRTTVKYSVENNYFYPIKKFDSTPLCAAVPLLEWELKKQHPKLCDPMHEVFEMYPNFKKEQDLEGILGILPAGQKYGGYVKALLHRLFTTSCDTGCLCDIDVFKYSLGRYRAYYNNTIYSNEKRIELFAKLDVKEKDSLVWAEAFDKVFPRLKDLHKLFGQVA